MTFIDVAENLKVACDAGKINAEEFVLKMQSVKLQTVKVVRFYPSFWRWLFRRPVYKVDYKFEVVNK